MSNIETAANRLAAEFADAFNRADLEGMKSLLSEDASAEVLGSGFPVEQGPEQIASTSLPYLLEGPDGALKAEVHKIEGEPAVLLLRVEDGLLDVIVRVGVDEGAGRIQRLDYLVTPFRRDEMVRLVEGVGIGVHQEE